MSLIRNNRSTTDKTVTIKRFLDSEAFVTHTEGGTTTSFYSREWIGLNNYYLHESNHRLCYYLGDTIVIKALIAPDAEGPLFGCEAQLHIKAHDGYIYWMQGSTQLHSVAIDSDEPHLYGFISVSENGVTTIYPFYDWNKVGTSTTTQPSRVVIIGGYTYDSQLVGCNGTCIYSTGNDYAMKVYEVVGRLMYQSTSSVSSREHDVCHFYAVSKNLHGSNGWMYETRNNMIPDSYILLEPAAGNAVTGVTAKVGLGSNVTYGVQLGDLQTAFSKYKQLIACICDDGGKDTMTGWEDPLTSGYDRYGNHADKPQTFTSSGRTFTSAFYLPSSRQPSNAVAGDTPSGYEDGQLIKGRKAKWSIWNDAMAHGKYVKEINHTSPFVYQTYELRINYLRDFWGRSVFDLDVPDLLGIFDGYNTKDECNRPPKITKVGGMNLLKFYGTLLVDKSVLTQYQYQQDGGAPCYPYTPEFAGAQYKVVLGNLPWWHHTRAQMEDAPASGFVTPAIYGAYLQLQGWIGGLEPWQTIASFPSITTDTDSDPAYFHGYIPLCADSSPAMKQLYQITGVTTGNALAFNYDKFRLCNEDEMFSRLILSLPLTPVTPLNPETNCVDCSKYVAPLVDEMSRRNLTEDLILFDNDGKVTIDDTEYNIYLSKWKTPTVIPVEIVSGTIHDAVGGFGIALVPSSVESPSQTDTIDLFSTVDSPKYLLYMDVTRMRSWADMLGTYTEKVVHSEVPDATLYIIDDDTNTVYHYDNGEYVEDEVVSYDSFPALSTITEADYHKFYDINGSAANEIYYRLSKGRVDAGATGSDRFVEMPTWYKQCSLRSRIVCFATPYSYMNPDVPAWLRGDAQGNIPTLPRYQAAANVFTYKDKTFTINGGMTNYGLKSALAISYLRRAWIGNKDREDFVPTQFGDTSGVCEPAVIKCKFFERSTAPWAWDVYRGLNTSSLFNFSDKAEGWFFKVDYEGNRYTYVVINADNLATAQDMTSGVVARFYLRLYYGNIEKIKQDDYIPFALKLYKQTPATYEYERSDYGATDLFPYEPDGVQINTYPSPTGTNFAGNSYGDYHIELYAGYGSGDSQVRNQYIGYSADYGANNNGQRYGQLNPDCFTLEITYTGSSSSANAPKAGDLFLIQLKDY